MPSAWTKVCAILDHAGQIVQHRAVGPLDDVVLLLGPLELDPATDVIVENTPTLSGHLQAHPADV